MKKRIISIIFLIVSLFCMPISFQCIEASSKGSIQVHIERNDGVALKDVDVRLYKVATFTHGVGTSFELTEEFKDCDIDLDKLSINSLAEIEASKCLTYIHQNNISYIDSRKSDGNGLAYFTDVDEALYLITQSSDNEEYIFSSAPFWVSMPMNDENGNQTYNVKVQPKNKVEYPQEYIKYTVNKCWVDNNNSHKKRPEQILVELYANNELKETVTLNALNNWSYEWKTLDTSIKWSVKEKNVPKYYDVKIENKETQFIITNVFNEDEVDTNDTSKMQDYMILLMGSISIIMVISIFKENRKRKNIQ